MNLTISQILISSLLALLFLFGNRVWGKSVSAITRFAIGMILAVVFLIPIRLPILKVPLLTPPKTEDTIPFLGEDEMQDLFFGEIAIPEKTPTQAPQTEKQGFSPVSPRALFAAAYLLGVLFTLFRMIFRYCRTAKAMLRCGRAPSEKERVRFEEYCKEMGVRRAPRLLVCPASALPSPLMFGFFRQTVLLSDEMSAENASVLIGHELMHCKRNDPLWKLIFALLRALYWFHPAVRLFIRTMNFLCEEACDEAFLREKSKEEKLFYCKLLVMTASSLNMEHSTAFTAFKGGKTQMKRRIQNIFSKKSKPLSLMFISLLLVSTMLFIVGCSVTAADKNASLTTENTTEETTSPPQENIKLKSINNSILGGPPLSKNNILDTKHYLFGEDNIFLRFRVVGIEEETYPSAGAWISVYLIQVTDIYGSDMDFDKNRIYRMAFRGSEEYQLYSRPTLEIGEEYVRLSHINFEKYSLMQMGQTFKVADTDKGTYIYGYSVDISQAKCAEKITDYDENQVYEVGKHDAEIAYLQSTGMELPFFEYKAEPNALIKELIENSKEPYQEHLEWVEHLNEMTAH